MSEQLANPVSSADETSDDLLKTSLPFAGFVVAIGASAGGLDALERLFAALPADTGAAFVVIQHLSPDHKSMMDSLLGRYTAMSVCVVEHDMLLAPNRVFLIPPGKFLALLGDRLQLAPKPEHGLTLPIDLFFNSLAEQCQERALAVVLSGTGSDGARGLVNVNAGGGFVFVQDPNSAKFDGMPRSAVATGLVDVVAAPEDLAASLVKHLSGPAHPGASHPAHGDIALAPIDKILERLIDASGIDFRDYKQNTVLRRIERRLKVLRCKDFADYFERLAQSKEEQLLLRRELLIPVTRFFRDKEAFDRLAVDVIPAIVAQHRSTEPIRVWVACTATGEEAYSIAILFAEALERHSRQGSLKIFATDIEPLYLEHASAGVYPDTIAAEVSPERLERYFVHAAGQYTVRPEIRQSVIFARHNLISDPPFTRMHLVTCRNALIYWKPAAQERALHRLQYALLPQAYLFLGPSETLGPVHRDFTAAYAKQKIYRLIRKSRSATAFESLSAPVVPHRRLAAVQAPLLRAPDEPSLVESGQRQLAHDYVPPSLLVSENRELMHVYGDASAFLRVPAGQPTLDVVKLLPRELAWAATALLQAVSRQRQDIKSPVLEFGEGHPQRRLVLAARPLGEQGATGPVPVLLTFEILDRPGGSADVAGQPLVQLTTDERHHMEMLERELGTTRDSLQATIEELETSNEELQATNEELMASNEELQSTNEELQSVNEELYTVNSEFQEKVDILNMINADLENVSTASGIPTVFVDQDLRLTRFTPEASQIFKLREGDVGRSLEDFAHTLDYPELFSDLKRTMANGLVTEREVRSRTGLWWGARIQPYADTTRIGRRAVMAFFDITSVKDSQRMQAIIDSLPEQLAVLDEAGAITLVNAAWRRFAQNNGDPELRATGPGTNYLAACSAAAARDATARRVHDGLSDVLAGRATSFSVQYPCHSPTERRWFLMHAAPVAHRSGGAVVSHIDISPWMNLNPPAAHPSTVEPELET